MTFDALGANQTEMLSGAAGTLPATANA